MKESCSANDLTQTRIAWLVWRLPAGLLLLGLFWSEFRAWLWTPALVVAGSACLVNAARCHRLHCYFTGPLYLLGAAYVILAEFHAVPMRPGLFLLGLVGASAIAQLAELPVGKYLRKA